MARIYCETLPYDDLLASRSLALLRRFDLEVVLAVRPWQIADLPRVTAALDAFSLWPMLDDDEGRWANVHVAASFADLVERVCDVAGRARAILFDLEPPFSGDPFAMKRLAPHRFAEGARILAQAANGVRARGIGVTAAVWPMLAPVWQRVLGTPLDALRADHVSVMIYTTILEGWSRGFVRRPLARTLLARWTRRARARFGARAGVSVGCVGTGAFGREPVYRGPGGFADDVRIARENGVSELSLFDFAGVLKRPDPEAWLEAFTSDTLAVR